jgi:hypothetical protein
VDWNMSAHNMVDQYKSNLQWEYAAHSGQVRRIHIEPLTGRKASTPFATRKSPISWITSTPLGTRLSLHLPSIHSHLSKSIYTRQLLPETIRVRHLIATEQAFEAAACFSTRAEPSLIRRLQSLDSDNALPFSTRQDAEPTKLQLQSRNRRISLPRLRTHARKIHGEANTQRW